MSAESKFTGESSQRLRMIMQIVAPFLGILVGSAAFYLGGLHSAAAITLAIAVWTALWWIFEAVPIPVASLFPLALLPLFGVLTPSQIAAKYGHHLVLLLLGGFLLSKAMEKSGTHRRIALMMVNACPSSGRFLVLGFMIATAFLSMWISNTATTLMMLPMAIAVMQNCKDSALKIPLLLGIAFAANVGGFATPIGTPPNLIMIGEYKALGFPELSFVEWMKLGVPISGITALAWMTRTAPFGGWKTWLDLPNANDASVAFIAVILLFCIPSGARRGEKLLDWETANKIPWGMLVLVGSGLCLGEGFKQSGLSESIASVFHGIEHVPTLLLLLGVTLLVSFLTEMTSNTATTNVLMPILGAAATASNLDPKLLMLPAALSASCAFMLPVATIPNAIVFGTGEISVKRMAAEGVVLNLIGAGVISLVCYLFLK